MTFAITRQAFESSDRCKKSDGKMGDVQSTWIGSGLGAILLPEAAIALGLKVNNNL